MVTYSNADDAAVAMKELNCIAGLVVDFVDTRYVGETHRDETSEYPCDWFPQDMYSDMPPQRLPSVDTSYAFYREVMRHLNSQKYCICFLFSALL